MRLFAIYIGGEVAGGNIEVHDIRFVVASAITETYETLKQQWWGIPKSLHVDCWAEIDQADGYDIALRPEPFDGPEKLYYVNLGGYDKSHFTEMHKNVFVVAKTIPEAKSRALKLAKEWDAPHRDEMYEAEQAFSLEASAREKRLYIHLAPAAVVRALTFTCDYQPIR